MTSKETSNVSPIPLTVNDYTKRKILATVCRIKKEKENTHIY